MRGLLNTPRGLALDTSDNVWVAEDVSTTAGVILEYASGTVNSYNAPTGDTGLYNLAVDGNNNVFVTLANQKLLKLPAGSTSGAAAVEYATSGIGGAAQCLAIDANEAIYISAASTSNGVTKVVPGTNPDLAASSTITKTLTMVSPFGVAIDANGVVWTADRALYSSGLTGNYITQVTTSGNSAAVGNTGAGNGIGDGGISDPQFIAVDGANHLWVSNFGTTSTGVMDGGMTVSEFDAATRTAITNTTGYVHTFSAPRDITVDQSGNVWVGSENSNANQIESSVALTEIVGAGAPTYGSKSLAAANNKIGQKP